MKRTPLFAFVFIGIFHISTSSHSMINEIYKIDKIHKIVDEGQLYIIKKYIELNPKIINTKNSIGQTVLDRAIYLYVYNKENSHAGDIYKERTERYKKIVIYLLLNKASIEQNIIKYYHIEEHETVLKKKIASEIIQEIENLYKKENFN